MSEQTKIQWADATWNPWIGCTKVSAGCKNCYAENTTRARVLRSQGHETWGKGAKRSRTSAANWKQPLKWNRDIQTWKDQPCDPRFRSAVESHPKPKVFPSLCDWLDDEVPIEWLADFLKLIHDTPNLTWILLTKRPENFKELTTDVLRHIEDNPPTKKGDDIWPWLLDWVTGEKIPPNVWILASVENQEMADQRIPELLEIPAVVRGLSVEPMLGPISHWSGINQCQSCGGTNWRENGCRRCADCGEEYTPFDWAIFGGESGKGARPCNVEWIRQGVQQCKAAGVPVFVKQLGAKPVQGVAFSGTPLGETECIVFENIRDPKGGDMSEWPEDLRNDPNIRAFPKV